MNLTDYGLLEAAAYYAAPPRHYHNIQHAIKVYEAIEHIYPGPLLDSLTLATVWHDAVYIPGAEIGDNEKLSALALRHWKKTSVNAREVMQESVDRAAEMIECTSILHHADPQSHVTAMPHARMRLGYLLDADLSGLAADYDNFIDNQRNIIMENGGDPDSIVDQKNTATFLSIFLPENRRGATIYRTQTAQNCWEEAAVRNIRRFIEDTSGNHAVV